MRVARSLYVRILGYRLYLDVMFSVESPTEKWVQGMEYPGILEHIGISGTGDPSVVILATNIQLFIVNASLTVLPIYDRSRY